MTSLSAHDAAWIERFLEMIQAERGRSFSTCKAYQADLQDFAVFLNQGTPRPAHPQGSALAFASAQAVRRYMDHLIQATGCAASTRARRLSSLRQFYSFLVVEKHRPDNPMTGISGPRAAPPLPKILTEEEMVSLIEAVQQLDIRDRTRLVALVEVMYAGGLRVSELVSLTWSQWNPENATLRLRGKGSKERMVPMTSVAQALLCHLFQKACHRRPCTPSATQYLIPQPAIPWIFPSWSAQGHLTRQGFSKSLKKLAETAGLSPSRVSPHVIRHAFATHLLDRGMDLLNLQKLLGHADIQTTQIYTHVSPRQLNRLMEQHPLVKRLKPYP